MSKIMIIAKKEFAASYKDKVFFIMIVFFLVMSIASVYIGSTTKNAEIRAYSDGQRSAIDAANDNNGGGSFVNVTIDDMSLATSGILRVFDDVFKSTQIATLNLPAGYSAFAFQIRGSEAHQNYYVTA